MFFLIPIVILFFRGTLRAELGVYGFIILDNTPAHKTPGAQKSLYLYSGATNIIHVTQLSCKSFIISVL